MSAASLFATCVPIRNTRRRAITLHLAATSPAVGVAPRFSLAAALTFLWCIALAVAENVLAPDRSVKFRA